MATVRFRLRHPEEKPEKEKSIQVELYINAAIRPEISTGEKILVKHWNGSRANSKAPDYHRINDNLSRIERELTQLWRDNLSDLSKIPALMKAVVRGNSTTTEKKTLFTALDAFITQYENDKDSKTVAKYKSLRARLVEFDKKYPIDFDSLDYNFYDAFKRFLYESPNPLYQGYSLYRSVGHDYFILRRGTDGIPVGLFDDTVYKYFINLKTFLSWSAKRGHKVNPSHQAWEIIKRTPDPISLTAEELERLERHEFKPEQKHLDIARDYLVFECRTGQRISDIKRFDVRDYEDFKWTHKPKKGNRLSAKSITVHFAGISQPALLILAKRNFKFPAMAEQTINSNIKIACKEAKINTEIYIERWAGSKCVRIYGPKYEFLSTHNGRATFITLSLQYGMPKQMVMELTGIAYESTIKHYKADFDDKSKEEYLTRVSENMSLMRKAE